MFIQIPESRVANAYIIEKGYELTFRSPQGALPRLVEDDVPNFAHVILFSSETKCNTPFSPLELFLNR